MKVPKMYKSSGRYNAGTDVIYNDDSKLQYAPFIYATAESGDNGGDGGGDDEEGEDTMVVIFDSATGAIDKSFKELKDAVNSGKIVLLKRILLDDETGFAAQINYLTSLDNQGADEYVALFSSVHLDDGEFLLDVVQFDAANETDNMTIHTEG